MLFSKLNINILQLIFFLIPLSLVTGPALPDILAGLFSILFIVYFFINKKKFNLKHENWIVVLFILWMWFMFISFFAINFNTSIIDAIIFIRFILFITFSYFMFLNLSKRILLLFLNVLFFLCVLVAMDTLFQFYNYSYYDGFGKDLFGRIPEGLYGRLSGPFSDLVPGSFLSRVSL